METARKLDYLKTNPLDAVVLPKMEKPPLKTMEREEMVRFLDAIKGNRYEKILFVTLFTGLRQGEVLGLTWDCVNFEHNTLLINKQHNRVKGEKEYKFSTLKNARIRVLTVAQEVMDVLRQQKEQQEAWAKAAGAAWNNADNLVFTNELGRFVANQALYRNYKSIVKKIGLGNLRFHDPRPNKGQNAKTGGFPNPSKLENPCKYKKNPAS